MEVICIRSPPPGGCLGFGVAFAQADGLGKEGRLERGVGHGGHRRGLVGVDQAGASGDGGRSTHRCQTWCHGVLPRAKPVAGEGTKVGFLAKSRGHA